jgi:hypothetical protein
LILLSSRANSKISSQPRRRPFVLDDGEATIFDFVAAKYSVSREWGKCLLHLRSSARNTVRRIVDVQRWSTHARIAREQAVKRCLCSIP